MSEPADRSNKNAEPVLSTLLAECPELEEVVEEFARGLPLRLEKMTDALRAESYEQLARVAHQLKGAGGSHGYAALTTRAAIIEQAAHARAIDDLQKSLQDMARLIDRIIAGLQNDHDEA